MIAAAPTLPAEPPRRVTVSGRRSHAAGPAPAVVVARVAAQAAPAPVAAPAAHQPPPPVSAAPAVNAVLPPPPAATPAPARPEPTREAVLSAYHRAIAALPAVPTAPFAPPPPRPAPATTVSMLARSASRPTPAPTAPLITPFGISRLSRVETENSSPPTSNDAPKAEPVDLDALADHVLERLRHELRDGRERLGFLLDDNR